MSDLGIQGELVAERGYGVSQGWGKKGEFFVSTRKDGGIEG
ncbi:MAG: hypothetical protein SAL07_24410 [Oscillatoria sp. PMC 1051.18]|nr:hypothetical protein [Oscillatoria sp. PMC 1051.18]MEC5033053.1 hypothetical protein [Oscillatoria sp. PMC 1051.18]